MSAEQEDFLLTETAPAPKPKPAKHTEASMIELLHQRYGTRSGNGPRYAGVSHVRSDAGFDAKRTADFIAIDLWPSKGLTLHGHEVKISRSDWLNELKDPDKSAEFMKHVDYWWLVIADAAMVRPGELPHGWGMMAPRADGVLAVVRQAPRLNKPVNPTPYSYKPEPVHRGLVAAMLRSAGKEVNRASAAAVQAFRASHTVKETYTLDEWNPTSAQYEAIKTFTDAEAVKAAVIACHAAGNYRLHGTIHRTYTYTETEWI